MFPALVGFLKKSIPMMAMGSLFNAPIMLKVVDDVTRMHQMVE